MKVAGTATIYPAFDPEILRYGVHPASDGSLGLAVTGASAVWFNGVPDPDAHTTLSLLTAGAEVSVFIEHNGTRRAYALYVLPTGFPTLAASATGADLQPGNVALTLSRYDNVSPLFEAIVDRHGVPVYTRPHRERVLDLKMAANGRFTVHRPTTTPGRTGGALVELDDQFRELRRIETTGLRNTDDHDSLLLPDGSRWLTAYEENSVTNKIDSLIQHVASKARWTSSGRARRTSARRSRRPIPTTPTSTPSPSSPMATFWPPSGT